MSGLYSIPVSGLKDGQHLYDFKISNEFFELFEESEIKEGALEAIVEADKRSSHIDLVIRIKGKVRISCDRCLGIFSQPVDCTSRLLVKFSRTLDESDPDIITVPADDYELDLKQYFYEYILLALPIQKVHPNDKTGKSTCDPEMLKILREHASDEVNETDPRWDDLKKLINQN